MFIFLEIKICSSVHPSLVCTKVRKRCQMMSANSNTALVFFSTQCCASQLKYTLKVVFFPWDYPASRGFSLVWLLVFMKSFASIVSHVQGVYNKPTTQLTSDTNNFINTQSHAREKPLLAM